MSYDLSGTARRQRMVKHVDGLADWIHLVNRRLTDIESKLTKQEGKIEALMLVVFKEKKSVEGGIET